MLSQIVRPMVNTQIKLLAKSKTTRNTLIKTIAKWLGYLGVEAHVTELDNTGDKITVSLTVSKPDTADNEDWQKILNNISNQDSLTAESESTASDVKIPSDQQIKYQRVLAYAIQMSYPDDAHDWSQIYPRLQGIGLEESMLLGIKSALKVPQSIDRVVKELDADVAAEALSQTASIALQDRQINPQEYRVLHTLLEAMAENCE